MFEEGLYYKIFKWEEAVKSYEKGIQIAFELYENKKETK